ncbi:MAG TPA: hypothetical protein PK559_11650 [Ignavibacteriaceae bacterium]|nr:hypothetical protein [Ignavibacteriaceae bacterium]
MRRVLLSMVFILNSSVIGFAMNQNNSDSVMVTKLVNQQISDAVTKQNQPAKTFFNVGNSTKKENIEINDLENTSASVSQSFSGTSIKLFILASASVLATMFIFYRRRMVAIASSKINSYKETINLIRSEKIRVRTGDRLRLVRNKLVESKSIKSSKDSEVARKAKSLNVSREELILAEKLRQVKLENNF